jgi:iron complex transport system substrate-binding protein
MSLALIDRPVPVDDLTRRGFLASATAAALLTACTSASTSNNQAGTGEWSFTDDRGTTVTLPSRPTRIAAFDNAAAALLSLGVRPLAIFGSGPLDQNPPSLKGLDLTGIESAGETYGEVNVEKLAALDIDLVVTAFDPRQAGPIFGFVQGPVQGQVEQVAPIVAINAIEDLEEVIRRFEDLAVSLGADSQAPEVMAARQRLDDARADLRAAATAKPGLLALAVLAGPSEGISFLRPAQWPTVRQLQQLGLDIVVPEGGAVDVNEDIAGFFYESLSLEQAGKYPADLLLLNQTEPQDMAGVATWDALPAVQAGQLVGFNAVSKWVYHQQADELEAIAAAVRAANPNLV